MNPVRVDGDTININPKDMEVRKIYEFWFKGEKHFERPNGEVVVLESLGEMQK